MSSQREASFVMVRESIDISNLAQLSRVWLCFEEYVRDDVAHLANLEFHFLLSTFYVSLSNADVHF